MNETEVKSLSFEQAMDELELVVRQLEAGKIKLDDAVAAYEKGRALQKQCEEKLASAKAKIDILLLDKNNTPIGVEPFHELSDKSSD
ncbi:MAG: exodeoxyribonuclease VII small subunit [Alphaproteobacteria bacterium]